MFSRGTKRGGSEGRKERCDNAENIVAVVVFLCLVSFPLSLSSLRFVLRFLLENREVGSVVFNALNQHGNIQLRLLAFRVI